MLRSKQPRQETNVYSIRMERNRKHAWTGIRENRTSSRNDHRDVHRGQVEMRVKRIGHVALPKIYIYIFLNEILTRKEARNWGIDRWRNRVFCFSRNLKEGRGRFRGKTTKRLVETISSSKIHFRPILFRFSNNLHPIGWPSALEIVYRC